MPRATRDLALLACIVLASLALRIYVSERCSLWLDEAWTRHDIAVSWPDLLRGPSREHPPLMYVLVRLAVDVLGTSDTAVRSVSLLFGCVLLVAVYLVGLELELRPGASLVVTGSLALAPFFLRHATEARQYAILSACIALALLFTLRLLKDPGRAGALIGFCTSAVAAAATHYFGLAYAVALTGALAAGTFPAWRRKLSPLRVPYRTAAALAFLGLGLGLVIVRAVWLARFYTSNVVGPPERHLLSDLLAEFSFFATHPALAKAEPFVSAAGLLLAGYRQRGIARVVPFALAFPPCALALLVSSGHALVPRYLAPSFVVYHWGAAAALVALYEAVRGGSRGALRLVRSLAALPVLLVPFTLRLKEFPAGFGAGHAYNAGLRDYFRGGRARGTALVVFPHLQGEFLLATQYPVDAPMQTLERFAPIPGIHRYLVAEFERASLQRQFYTLLLQRFHLSPGQWRKLPLVKLGRTRFQAPVRARLVTLDSKSPPEAQPRADPSVLTLPGASGDAR